MSAPSPSLADVFVRSDRIVGRRLLDEFILVPIVSHGADIDSIFSLNRVGALIWETLDGRRSGDEVVAAIVERFDVAPERAAEDYADFLAKLSSVDAVKRVGGDSGAVGGREGR
jgi:hypothetical protein